MVFLPFQSPHTLPHSSSATQASTAIALYSHNPQYTCAKPVSLTPVYLAVGMLVAVQVAMQENTAPFFLALCGPRVEYATSNTVANVF